MAAVYIALIEYFMHLICALQFNLFKESRPKNLCVRRQSAGVESNFVKRVSIVVSLFSDAENEKY